MPPTPPSQKMGDLHEAHLAEVFSGARTRGSGSQWFDPADGRNHHDVPFAFAWDGKSTKGKGITVTLETIAKIREQALGDRPALGLRWYANEVLDKVAEDWVAVPGADFEELLEAARKLAALEAEHGDLGRLPEEIEDLRGKASEATVIAENANTRWAEAMNAARGLREELARSKSLLLRAGEDLGSATEELARYRSGRIIPPHVPRLPWTVVFQVHLPGRAELTGMHYARDGVMTQVKVECIRVERDANNRPRLFVNEILAPDGDLYVDGVLTARAWRDNRDGEVG